MTFDELAAVNAAIERYALGKSFLMPEATLGGEDVDFLAKRDRRAGGWVFATASSRAPLRPIRETRLLDPAAKEVMAREIAAHRAELTPEGVPE